MITATAIVALVVGGCASGHSATPRVALSRQSSPDVFPFRIGELDAVALKDGDIDIPNDGKVFGVGRSTTEIGDLLAGAGRPRERLQISIQPLLVRDGARILLFDVGAAGASFARAGRLPKSLEAAGVTPADVTDIFISHYHDDHVKGLVTQTSTLAFPNATIHVSAPEWAAMQMSAQPLLAATIASKVAPFEPGAQILPEVTAVPMPGHTEGHSGYEISSAGQKLLYLGDVVHHEVFSLARPNWIVAWDKDATSAEAVRERTLARIAGDGERVYAYHFPFPGLGRVQMRGDAFAWVPEP